MKLKITKTKYIIEFRSTHLFV